MNVGLKDDIFKRNGKMLLDPLPTYLHDPMSEAKF